jgi:Fic-DOC domain mobile mystery protein B
MVDEIHRRMFGNVWKWAGKRRTRITSIGVAPAQIVTQLKDALEDARYWHDNETFDPVEAGVRIHHRLVFVHPYVNGDGRHARLVADPYLHLTGGTTLRWGPDEAEPSDGRADYVAALRNADEGDYSQLIAYARASTHG